MKKKRFGAFLVALLSLVSVFALATFNSLKAMFDNFSAAYHVFETYIIKPILKSFRALRDGGFKIESFKTVLSADNYAGLMQALLVIAAAITVLIVLCALITMLTNKKFLLNFFTFLLFVAVASSFVVQYLVKQNIEGYLAFDVQAIVFTVAIATAALAMIISFIMKKSKKENQTFDESEELDFEAPKMQLTNTASKSTSAIKLKQLPICGPVAILEPDEVVQLTPIIQPVSLVPYSSANQPVLQYENDNKKQSKK